MSRRSLVLFLWLALSLLSACGGGSSTPTESAPPAAPPPPQPPEIIMSPTKLPGATAGVPYSVTFSAQGGTAPYVWSADALTVPQGFTLSTNGVLSGTSPQFFGGDPNPVITLHVKDSSKLQGSATKSLSFDIFGFEPIKLPLAQVAQDFSQQGTFVSLGGTQPYKWTLSGTPPPGLVFREDPAGGNRQYQLAGSPTRDGTYQFSITVTDSGSPARSETVSYPLAVEPAQLVLPHLLLPTGVVGQGYNYQFVLQGGAGPYQWSIKPVLLPPGLQFDNQNGRLTGTPTAAGYASLLLSVSDNSSPKQQSVQQSYWVLVTPNALPPRNNSIADATPIFPGYYTASISPYGDPAGTVGPDEDYYSLTAPAGTTYQIFVGAGDGQRLHFASTIDPVLEIVDSTGQRYSTCNDPSDDDPPPGVPIAKDPTPDGYDDPCMNHLVSYLNDPNKAAVLGFSVPGSGTVTFYLHIFDFRGDARPDMVYTLTIQ
jgi:hypothetical protein